MKINTNMNTNEEGKKLRSSSALSFLLNIYFSLILILKLLFVIVYCYGLNNSNLISAINNKFMVFDAQKITDDRRIYDVWGLDGRCGNFELNLAK